MCRLLSLLTPGEPCALAFSTHLERALAAELRTAAAAQPAVRMIKAALVRAAAAAAAAAADRVGEGVCGADFRAEDGCDWVAGAGAEADSSRQGGGEWVQLPPPLVAVVQTAAASAHAACWLRTTLHRLSRPPLAAPAGTPAPGGAPDGSGGHGGRSGRDPAETALAVEVSAWWAVPLLATLESAVAVASARAAKAEAARGGAAARDSGEAAAMSSLVLSARLCGALAAQLPRWPLAFCQVESCAAAELQPLVAAFASLEGIAHAEWARLAVATRGALPPRAEEASGVYWRAVEAAHSSPAAAEGALTEPRLTLPAEASAELSDWLWRRHCAVRATGSSALQPRLLEAEAEAAAGCLAAAFRSQLERLAGDDDSGETAEARQRQALQLYFDVTLCRAALRSRPQPLPPADARVSAQRHEFDKAARATLAAAAAKLGAAAREPPLPRDKAAADDGAAVLAPHTRSEVLCPPPSRRRVVTTRACVRRRRASLRGCSTTSRSRGPSVASPCGAPLPQRSPASLCSHAPTAPRQRRCRQRRRPAQAAPSFAERRPAAASATSRSRRRRCGRRASKRQPGTRRAAARALSTPSASTRRRWQPRAPTCPSQGPTALLEGGGAGWTKSVALLASG